ncbi:MAG: hypothetical protein M3Y80_10375 [Verrucomicrobiota bacterium]|nr:hypothetical protein [Verrucomicrobiota bacterium]
MTSATDHCALVAALLLCAASSAVAAMDDDEPGAHRVIVEAQELPSAYGAPPDLSHGRISTLTKSYVLAPFSFELENSYTAAVFRHHSPAHNFGQEIELGLPARFTVGLKNQLSHFSGRTEDESLTLEGRYALANWNKLPLNPAISAEYRFGVGHSVQDSGEFALLVSHDFPHEIEWALNIFADREFGRRRSTAAGFAQSIEFPILLPEEKLEIGGEMQYRTAGEEAGHLRTGKGLQIGPTLAWRPTKDLRFDLSPLFGLSRHTPAMQVFVVVSWSFGKTEAGETEAPASAHAR